MKYKIITLAAVLVMLLTAVFAQRQKPENNRFHQHLQTPQKQSCTTHGETVFCSHLPVLNITTEEAVPLPFLAEDENGQMAETQTTTPVRNYRSVLAEVEYFDSETENNHLTDTPVVKERAFFRTRGASSREFDKKGYLLKFTDENTQESKKVSLSGMVEDRTWVLHGPYLDKTLIRNYICYNLAGEIMDYAPNVRFCEMFVNGEYAGLYLITEKVKFNENGRISVTPTDPDLNKTSYIVKIDRKPQDKQFLLNTFGKESFLFSLPSSSTGWYEITYPSETLTEGQKEYIQNDLSCFEKTLSSFDSKDADHGYIHDIDVDSFVNYFILNEFTLNYDAVYLSTYLYRDVRGKIKLCAWDFNNALDLYNTPYLENQAFLLQKKSWYRYLFKDPYFANCVIDRYRQLRKTYLSEEYLLNYIDSTIAYLGPAIDRNYKVWGYSFNPEHDLLTPQPRNPRTYDEAIAQLKHCICERLTYMDNHIEALLSLSHESVNKNYNYDLRNR